MQVFFSHSDDTLTFNKANVLFLSQAPPKIARIHKILLLIKKKKSLDYTTEIF